MKFPRAFVFSQFTLQESLSQCRKGEIGRAQRNRHYSIFIYLFKNLVGEEDASIKIDENEYLLDTQRGLGIVVYDKILDKVIDSVTFDIKNNGKCYRNNNIE